jgi:hypothetical protein
MIKIPVRKITCDSHIIHMWFTCVSHVGFYICFSSRVVHMWIICESHVIVPIPRVNHMWNTCVFSIREETNTQRNKRRKKIIIQLLVRHQFPLLLFFHVHLCHPATQKDTYINPGAGCIKILTTRFVVKWWLTLKYAFLIGEFSHSTLVNFNYVFTQPVPGIRLGYCWRL